MNHHLPENKGSKKVLIVDDEMDMRIFLRTFFKTGGHEPVVCRDGKEGLSAAITEKPDLIILDVMMPNDGGALMYKALKSDPALRSIPVIMFTAIDEITFTHYINMLRAQFEKDFPAPDAYIEKPPDIDQLKKVSDTLLGVSASH